MRLVLKNSIARAGFTQRALARRVGMRETRLSDIVRGFQDPNEDEKRVIAELLKRSPRGLFRNMEIAPPSGEAA